MKVEKGARVQIPINWCMHHEATARKCSLWRVHTREGYCLMLDENEIISIFIKSAITSPMRGVNGAPTHEVAVHLGRSVLY
jgi:hypothetical protein